MRAAAVALVLVLAPSALHAEVTPGDCFSGITLSEAVTRLATVTGQGPRVFFRRNAMDAKGCPANTSGCQSKSYVVPNDEVFLGRQEGAFVCASFVSAKGRETAGWLRMEDVSPRAVPAAALQDWPGTWTDIEKKIIITRGKAAGTLAVAGEATFGGSDPVRVRNGSVSSGEIRGDAPLKDGMLAFTMGEDRTLGFGEGDEFDCRARFLRLGAYLVVEDNGQCGGINVRFTGLYRRAK